MRPATPLAAAGAIGKPRSGVRVPSPVPHPSGGGRMLVEIAVGDAYGAGFEYAPERLVRERNDLSGYVAHPTHALRPGCYTDDTQMSIAVAEAILSGERWTPALLARHFVAAFRRDRRQGYARGFYDFLCGVRDEEEFLARIRSA